MSLFGHGEPAPWEVLVRFHYLGVCPRSSLGAGGWLGPWWALCCGGPGKLLSFQKQIFVTPVTREGGFSVRVHPFQVSLFGGTNSSGGSHLSSLFQS